MVNLTTKLMTPEYRLTLANQYQILIKLGADDRDYEQLLSIVLNGYEYEYYELVQDMYDPLPSAECEFVIQVLDMYGHLQRSWSMLTTAEKATVGEPLFPGFDGNTEGELVGYCEFLTSGVDQRFTYIKTYNPQPGSTKQYFNSHSYSAVIYNKQLATYAKFNKNHALYSTAELSQF